MERNIQIKILSIIALVLAITGMSLGFAAFSSTLNISSSATVTPNSDDFKIDFLGIDSNGEFTSSNSIYPITGTGATGSIATIVNGKSATISNMKASFTEPGQYVEYQYRTYNSGLYDAYFRSWQFRLLSGMSNVIECVPSANSDVSEELLNKACEDIDVRYHIFSSYGNTFMDGYARYNFDYVGTSVVDLGGHYTAAPGDYFTVRVVIEYAADGERADGDFEVKIADLLSEYGTAPLSE